MWTWSASRKKRGRGGGVGGAPPPRSAGSVLSHSPPRCNTNSTLCPTGGRPAPVHRRGSLAVGGFVRVGERGTLTRLLAQGFVPAEAPQRELRDRTGSVRAVCSRWDIVGGGRDGRPPARVPAVGHPSPACVDARRIRCMTSPFLPARG